MVWDEVNLPALRKYLDLRSAKTKGNREMSLLRLVWGKAKLWGMTRCPWPAEGIRGWKNEENARTFEVTPELFCAVYSQADQVLRCYGHSLSHRDAFEGCDCSGATNKRFAQAHRQQDQKD